MKLFTCQACGNLIHFDNTTCLNCGLPLGYLPDRLELSALRPEGDHLVALADPDTPYARCANAELGACNWLVAVGGPSFCTACRHNATVPHLADEAQRLNWHKLEAAKRYLFYSLLTWRLPCPDRTESPDAGLAFDFLADTTRDDGSVEPIVTGHQSGLITIALAEADDAERERRRTAMGEPYRTLLGHFRHEVGHYYWDRLVRDGGRLDAFRALFGDERIDYGDALDRHHRLRPPTDWPDAFISAYASAHPWEDFAETWAHYIHMVDALETAAAFGLRIEPDGTHAGAFRAELSFRPYQADSFSELVDAWVPLTISVNSINRSMGQPDLYPFVLSPPVIDKLDFVHRLVHRERRD